jgi:hypothetical protein
VGRPRTPELECGLSPGASAAQVADCRARSFSMGDVFESALLADDLRGVYRASLFTEVGDPLIDGTEANLRADHWASFEDTHLNRQQLCLGCHNPAVSTTGPNSDWNRHFPFPLNSEKAVFGSTSGNAPPPDLHADFRSNGQRGGGTRPWNNLEPSCGTFVLHPAPQTTCPTSTSESYDVCFAPRPGATPRAPRAIFAGESTEPSIFRLDALLLWGALGWTAQPVGPETPVHELPEHGWFSKGARGFAYMVAANAVDQIFGEVYGTRLTIGTDLPSELPLGPNSPPRAWQAFGEAGHWYTRPVRDP